MRSKSVPVNLLIRKIHSALGEGGEEGSPEESEKLEGEEETGSMTPTSVASPQGGDEGLSPPPGDITSPGSPRSMNEDASHIREHHSRGTSRASSSSPPSSDPILPPDRAALLQSVSLGAALSPVGVALPPSLPAGLLPPQSAAVAAYFSAAAAAAAAQQHRLMMATPMVSPPTDPSSNVPDGALDFSRRSREEEADVCETSSSPVAASGPLDLSVGARKRLAEDSGSLPPPRKQRPPEFKPPQWHLPYFAAAVAAAGLTSPKSANAPELWNGKLKPTAPSDATKALEKMSELSKLGGDELFRQASTPAAGRHSAWQSHWLNKGADQAKDVLKCVWCKQSFASLAALTTHMKEAKHCGVSVPPSNVPSSTSSVQPPPNSPPAPPKPELNALIKETMPLPRKLVRGQDVWLGKGAEQTRQILKCMWCGQSFRSLAEMTSHMQQTQHYTNIISQEQIISWRSSDDAKSSGNSTNPSGQPPPASSHVSAVLTCKVCDQAFSSLKELSNHMVKNSHYKEHIMRSITESGGRRRQTREKRKKSLPVRKLLELERAQHDFKNGETSGLLEKVRDAAAAGRITCEKCGHKIETALFVDHIRQCVGATVTSNQRNFLKSALMSNILPPESPTREKIKTPSDKSPSPQQRSPSVSDTSSKEPTSENNNGSSPSVLNAIEKLIEKSFDSRSRQNPAFPGPTQAPMGSSILKRLGIDESVDYTKPLVDPQTMSLLRSYHQQQGHHFGRRERSGSESSTMSERGSSRVDSLTPERKMEPPGMPLTSTPRSTPDIKREKSPDKDDEVTVKKEIVDEEDQRMERGTPEVKVKKEVEDVEEDERGSFHSNGELAKEDEDKRKTPLASPSIEAGRPSTPCRNSISPASSDRSGTPRSTTSDRKSAGGSLGALSSMFDNLSGTNSANEAQSSGKKGSSHPLAALQKLCDKTETHTTPNNRSHASSASAATSAATTSGATTPGAILAFSWACNDAVVTPDAIMKCAFCDTPFISKGAYRHHLSKMHFVKDGVIPDPVNLKASQGGSGSVGVPLKSTALPASVAPPPPVPKSPPGAGAGFEESPHSKFLKYTELAKQLSSKYV